MKLLLANGAEYEMVKDTVISSSKVNGSYIPSVKFYITGEMASIRKDFENSEATSLLTVITDNKRGCEYSGYQKLVNIGFSPDDSTEEVDVYTVTMALMDDVKELIKTWSEQLVSNAEKVNTAVSASESAVTEAGEAKTLASSLIPNTNIDTMTLEEAKEYRIKESKTKLATYLATNPIESTCHGKKAKYSIVSEKQQYLVSMIAIAQMAEASGVEYQPSWNATGEPCTYDWTVDQLKQLAFEMEQVVRPLISKQQTYEKDINACKSVDDVKTIEISY